jgi:type I restriction enzyme S subunit
MCKLLFDEEVANKTYVFYVLKTKEEDIKGAKSGTDDRHVDKEYFLNLLIPLPPLPEQSRIATVLSWFDDLIEIKKKQNEILEKTAMAIFKNWFIDFEPFKDEEFIFNEELGREIPKGWEVKKIGDVINFIYGKGLPEMNRKEGIYPVVGSSGIVGFHSEYIAEPPTIIIGRKGNAGSVQLFLENSYPIDTVFYSSKHTQPEIIFYVYHLLKIISLEDLALTDTAVPGLNIHMLNSLILFLPPPHILQSFHSLVEPLFQKIILNQKQIMTIRKIRDTLLPLLVFGKLRVEEL